MAKAFKPQIVSANDLYEGDVVYLSHTHGWTRDLSQAAVAINCNAAEALIAVADQQHALVVGPYLADVTLDADGLPYPSHFRERFRTRGPSNRPDLGRQATHPNRAEPLATSDGI